MLERIAPIEVRLLAPEKPPEPPPPPPAPKRAPPPAVLQPLPVAPPPVVMAVATPAPTTVVVPPVPVEQPSPQPEPIRAAPAPAPAPAPEPLIEARFDADYLSNPKPVYPSASRLLGEEGVVHLRVRVSADGTAEKVELKRSSGFPRLDDTARETLLRWHFVPARRGQTPVAAWVVVPLIFTLN